MKTISKIKELIVQDQLTTKQRHRHIIDRRSYLYYLLRHNGMSLTDIARMFEKTHAAVINGLKKHQVYSKYNDYTYKVNTQEYRKIFEPQYIEPRSLKDDILRCTNTTELKLIQERIIMGKYK